jgi:proline iminopeptidase
MLGLYAFLALAGALAQAGKWCALTWARGHAPWVGPSRMPQVIRLPSTSSLDEAVEQPWCQLRPWWPASSWLFSWKSAIPVMAKEASVSGYLDSSGREDRLSGGVRMIPVETPRGNFRVWTKRVGNNPSLRMLLLHGGPGATHEYLEACDSYLPGAEVEYYYYDQLGSAWSDQPDEPSLWALDRFVDEVEQVRQALGLDRKSFVLYGQSWGGILAIEYALRYQQHLRGLVISNMMADVQAYNAYAEQVLMPDMDQEKLAEIKAFEAAEDTENPRYMELLNEQHYVHHVLRMPVDEWPNPVQRAFAAINPAIYVSMQGPSELGISEGAALAHWQRFDDLTSITVPTLVIGARYDTMDPAHLKEMAARLPAGQYLHCPAGSHLAMYDDQRTYFTGLIEFLRGLPPASRT